MPDVVATVPKRLWAEWIAEGVLPGEDAGDWEFHFWIPFGSLPDIKRGERVYIVAHGRLRGYAPLVRIEELCAITLADRACLVRRGRAVAVTIDEPIRGFQGWRYRWWEREQERPFPDWATAGVPA